MKDIEGFRVVQEAGVRVKDFGMEAKEVTLVVTEAQVIVVERDTGDHIHEAPFKHISYRCVFEVGVGGQQNREGEEGKKEEKGGGGEGKGRERFLRCCV